MAAGESVESNLASLTATTGASPESVYARAEGLTLSAGESLEQAVRLKLTAGSKTSQLKESLLATVVAGSAVGESVEECLRKSSLTGWS